MRLRLLKVIVQPVFVVEDDDGDLHEHTAETVDVDSKEWPTYATGAFVAAFDELRSRVEDVSP